MADRYWVFGAGTWTSTANWSAAEALSFTASCSGTTLTTVGSPALVIGMTVRNAANTSLGTITGGSANTWTVSIGGTNASQTMRAATGGASVPTAADNVFFTPFSGAAGVASNYSVSLTTNPIVCNDFTSSAIGTVASPVPAFTGTTATLAVSGSLSWSANTIWQPTGTITFNATTSKTVSTNNINISAPIVFNGVGGSWTLGSTFRTSSSITLTNGTFDTSSSGNYSVSASTFISSNTNTRTINLNSSTMTLSAASSSALNLGVAINLTFNGASSQINLSNATSGISSPNSGLTFGALNFTSAALSSAAITGGNTFDTLSFAARTSVGIGTVTFNANQTIGTLTLNAGTTAAYRTFLASTLIGTPRTLAVTTLTAGAADYDFRDIAITGAAAPLSVTRAGDCKGNSGITFPTAKTSYYASAAGGNIGQASPGVWSLSNNGTPDDTAFPLAQDTIIFPQSPTLYPSSGQTVTINATYNLGSIDTTLRTSFLTINTSSAVNLYGSLIRGSSFINISSSSAVTYCGRTTQTISLLGSNFGATITINSPGGTFLLGSNFASSSGGGAVTFVSGTLSLQSFIFSASSFSSTGSISRQIDFGTGYITCFATTTNFTLSGATNLTTTGSQDVRINPTVSSTVSPGTLGETNSLNFNFLAGNTSVSGGNLKNFTGSGTVTFTSVGAMVIYGNLSTSTLTSATSLTFSASSGAKTIDTGGATVNSPITIGPAGGSTATWTLQNTLNISTRTLTLRSGTLDTGNFAVSAGSFSSTSGLTRAIAGGTSNWTVSGASWTVSGLNFSYSGTGTISMTSASPKTFAGAGYTYPTLNNGGAGALTVSGSNTFANLTNTVQPTTFTFTSGTTNSFTLFSIAGTAGNLVTLGATSTSQALLQKPSAWNVGINSVDAGNNAGLSFTGTTVNYLSISYIRGLVSGPSPSNFLVFF
jgi:hypothetical protein